MKYLYYFLHTFTGCPDRDLKFAFRGKLGICKKCGRKHFIFNKY